MCLEKNIALNLEEQEDGGNKNNAVFPSSEKCFIIQDFQHTLRQLMVNIIILSEKIKKKPSRVLSKVLFAYSSEIQIKGF